MLLRLYIISTLFALISSMNPVPAQDSREIGLPYIQTYLADKDYEGHTQVWFALQDEKNIMYFGTSAGLVTFDGTNWELVLTSSNSIVRSGDINEKNEIYFGGLSEFGKIFYDSSNTLHTDNSIMHKIPHEYKNFNDIWNVFCINEDVYFEASRDLFWYTQDTIKIIPKNSEFACSKVNNEIYLHDKNEGLKILYNGKFVPLPHTKDKIKGFNSATLVNAHTNGDLFIISKGDIFIYRRSLLLENGKVNPNKKVPLDIIQPQNAKLIDFLISNYAYKTERVNDTLHAIATAKGGALLLNNKFEIINHLYAENGLTSNMAFNVYADNAENLWITTQKGINYAVINSPVSLLGKGLGLKEYVLSLFIDEKTIFAGCYDGAYYLNQKSEKTNFQKFPNSNFPAWDFTTFKNTTLTSSEGIVQINDNQLEKIARVEIYSFNKNPRFPNHLFICEMDGFKAMEFGQTNSQKPELRNIVNFEEIVHTTRLAEVDNNNDFWITAEAQGIYKVEFTGKDINDYKIYHIDTTMGLPRMNMMTVKFIDDKKYVLTNKGIYYIKETTDNAGKKQFAVLPDPFFQKYFDSLHINDLLKDKYGNYWVYAGETYKILKYNKSNNTYTLDEVSLKNLGYVEKMTLSNNDKIAWIYGKDGIFKYDTQRNKDYNFNGKALIKAVFINGDSLIYGGVSDNTHKKALETKIREQLSLDYANNAIAFKFAAPYYEYCSKNEFSYKLKGFDKKWSEWTKESRKEYSFLLEGSYTFKVKAKNIYGKESEIASFHFVVQPPIYRTTAAYILYFTTLAFFIWLFLKLYILRLKRAKKKLESIVESRTTEIKSKNDRIKTINEELLFQNNEIQQRNAEIIQQKEQLEFVNSELEKLTIAVKETTNAVIIAEKDGQIEWLNNGFYNLYGYSLSNLIEQENNIYNLYAVKKYKIQQAIANRKSLVFHLSRKSKENKTIQIQTTVTPVFDRYEELNKIVAIDVNVSHLLEAKQLRRDLMVTNKINELKRQFLANMSHEMRTPMNGIIGIAEILKDRCNNNEDKEMIEIIHSSSESLMRIINNILEISKIGSGKIKLLPKPINLYKLLEQARLLFTANAKNKNLQIEVARKKDFPEQIIADENRILQVLSYLISNAIKFTEKGHIKMAYTLLKKDNNKYTVKVSVSDTGIGLPQEKKEEIFDLFSQIDNSMTRKYEGLGLGLAIAKELTSIMNGDIGVESQEGKGSNFWFTFEAVEKEPETEDVAPPILNLNVLIIDKSRTNRKFLKMAMEKANCVAHAASTIFEAYRLLRKNDYHLVLVEYNGKESSIEKYMQALHNILHYKPVLWALVKDDEACKNNCIEKETFDEILKQPFTFTDIYTKLIALSSKYTHPI